MRLEIATPHDRVVEVRVDGPADDEGGSLIVWTLTAVPATSAVLLDLTRVGRVEGELARSIDHAIRELDRRHVPIVVVLTVGEAVREWIDAGAAQVVGDVATARECAAALVAS